MEVDDLLEYWILDLFCMWDSDVSNKKVSKGSGNTIHAISLFLLYTHHHVFVRCT